MATSHNYRILRQFSGDRLFRVGEIVSLDGRLVASLVANRFIEPTDDPVTVAEVSVKDGFVHRASAPVKAQAASEAPKRPRGRPRKNPPSPSIQAGDNPTAA
jgi:hypothetical protein